MDAATRPHPNERPSQAPERWWWVRVGIDTALLVWRTALAVLPWIQHH